MVRLHYHMQNVTSQALNRDPYKVHRLTPRFPDYAAKRRGESYSLTQSWQAQLNAVFAIGAVYHNLTITERSGDELDHSIYHSRAWALVLEDRLWFAHSNLPQMQISGQFFYF